LLHAISIKLDAKGECVDNVKCSLLIEEATQMQNFKYRNPTRLIFGDGQVSQLKPQLEALGAKKVMLVYGGGSI
jgi:hypothetical protein